MVELPTEPINRNGNTPPPPGQDFDFIPDFETKVKYRRSSNVPDYRHSMYPAEPKLPVFAPSHAAVKDTNGSRRNSDLPVFAPQDNLENSRTSRRQSLGRQNGGSPGKQSRRSVSPEGRRSATMSFPAASRSGAVSPLSERSSSPVGYRSGFVSPIGRSGAMTPVTTYRNGAVSHGAVSPIGRSSSPVGQGIRRASTMNDGNVPTKGVRRSSTINDTTTTANHRQAALDRLQMAPAARRKIQSLTLDTQMQGGAVRPETAGSEESEEFDEVISLSPAVRAPVKKFRRASSAMAMSAHPDGKNMMLDSILEGSDKTYFGQDVNPEDLVAVNLENAFDRL